MTVILSPIDLTPGMILSDEVYARVGAAIVDGSLAPGRLLRDIELARELGVSRTPVREALQRLERFGLVEIAVGRYTRVSVPDDALRADTAEFTIYVMGNALCMALPRCTDDELAALVALSDAVVGAARAGSERGVFDAATALFIAVTRATANHVLRGVMREGALAIERNLRDWPAFYEASVRSVEGWRSLRDRIVARDGIGAEHALRALHRMPGAGSFEESTARDHHD